MVRETVAAGTDSFTSLAVSAPASALVLGLLGTDEGAVTTITAGTDFVMRNITAISGSANDSFAYESRTVANAGSVQALFTSAGATTGALVAVAVFQIGVPNRYLAPPFAHDIMVTWPP